MTPWLSRAREMLLELAMFLLAHLVVLGHAGAYLMAALALCSGAAVGTGVGCACVAVLAHLTRRWAERSFRRCLEASVRGTVPWRLRS